MANWVEYKAPYKSEKEAKAYADKISTLRQHKGTVFYPVKSPEGWVVVQDLPGDKRCSYENIERA